MDVGTEPIVQQPLDEALLARFKRAESLEEVRATANQLEGVFVSMMVQKMREALNEDGLFGDVPGADTFGGMFDQMMGEELSRRGGLGIADMVLRSVSSGTAEEEAPVVSEKADTEIARSTT